MEVNKIERTTGYFDNACTIEIDDRTVKISDGKFTYEDKVHHLEAIELELPIDQELPVNTRLYIVKEADGVIDYYCQSSYASEKSNGIGFEDEGKLIEVIFDITVNPDDTEVGFAQFPYKRKVEPINDKVVGTPSPDYNDIGEILDGPPSANKPKE